MKINTIVIKIASRCNINCTYCYMYNHSDQSYKGMPKFFSENNVNKLALRIKNHCVKHKINLFNIIFHGGEPLLYTVEKFRYFFEVMSILEKDEIKISYAMQTNGIMINKEFCDLFNKYNVGLGISLDGLKEVNDVNRLDKKGLGTYDDVVKGIEVARKNLKIPLGCLSVVNVNACPIETYDSYEKLGFKTIDFLMLDETHDSIEDMSNTLNGDWFIKLFDYWFEIPDDKRLNFRMFETVISFVLGNGHSVDGLGANKNEVMVVETDGGYEPVDVLKICGDSFTKLNLNLVEHEIDEIFNNDLVKLYYNSGTYLSKKCLACPIKEICGGGYLPHRYSSNNGFNNPSVYCKDLLKIITHIQNKVVENLPKEIVEESDVKRITYEEALEMIDYEITNVSTPSYLGLLKMFKKYEYDS